jgi:hypothetical protein
MDFHIVKMYKDKEVNKNVNTIFFINVWRKIVFDIYFTEFGTAWQLFCLFCSSIVINTVIVIAGTFEP